MMEFQFDHHAPHQLAAINAVVQVFKGQPSAGGAFENALGGSGSLDFGEKGIGNLLALSAEQLLANIQVVQKANNLTESITLIPRIDQDELANDDVDLNLSIEMETGTGKTYSYIRTMYELNKAYGFCKFVIVVPSVG